MTYYVCKDYYGKPFVDKESCFWVNKNYVIKAWKETRIEHKFGTEFDTEEHTYYLGLLDLGSKTEVFHFLRIKDYEDFTNGTK